MNAVRAAVLGIAALASATPAHAGWLLCSTPYKYLKFCCPKPCPVTDPPRTALHATKAAAEGAALDTQLKQNEATREVEQALGLPGPRSSTSAMASCPPPATVADRANDAPARTAPALAWEVEAPSGERALSLERMRHSVLADAWLDYETLSHALDAASESAAKAAQAVAHATDARDLVRRIAELRAATARADGLRADAERVLARLLVPEATRAEGRSQ